MQNKLEAYGDYDEGERVTVKVIEDGRAQIIDSDDLNDFWTFEVENRDEPLGNVINDLDKPVIGTSFHGEHVGDVESNLKEFDDSAVVFGSAWRGIPSMIERGDLDEEQIDLLVNFIPNQHTKTVRTEEALYICLSVLDHIRR